MKMLIFVAGACRKRSSCTVETSTTLPSAGETTARESSGTSRGGSRKNHRQKPAKIGSGRMDHG